MRPYLIILANFGLAAALHADTLSLKSGQTYQGTYLGGTARQIRMDLYGEVRTFDINQIQSLTFQQEAATEQPAARTETARPEGAPRLRRQATDPSGPAFEGTSNTASTNAGGRTGVTLDTGTQFTVRMIDPVDSETARLGQTFRASIDEPVIANDRTVIPRGADVLTKLVRDDRSGRIQGRTVLTLALVSVTVNGQPVDVTTSDVETASASRGARSGKVIGGTAALGAIIGAIAGGGSGAAIGAASGAAVGTGAQVATGGQKVKIPSETRLTFRLQNPVAL